jgi:hypothetical protein
VVIYTLTTTAQNAQCLYTVNDPLNAKYVLTGSVDGDKYNGPDFLEAAGDDPKFGTSDSGNFVVFRGLSGNTVHIEATNLLGGVAPINGIQIVAGQ